MSNEPKCYIKNHKESVNMEYLPHIGWYCPRCEELDGNETLNGYAPEKKKDPDGLTEEILADTSLLNVDQLAGLLVRRVHDAYRGVYADAKLTYERTAKEVHGLVKAEFMKLDDGIHRKEYDNAKQLDYFYELGRKDATMRIKKSHDWFDTSSPSILISAYLMGHTEGTRELNKKFADNWLTEKTDFWERIQIDDSEIKRKYTDPSADINELIEKLDLDLSFSDYSSYNKGFLYMSSDRYKGKGSVDFYGDDYRTRLIDYLLFLKAEGKYDKGSDNESL